MSLPVLLKSVSLFNCIARAYCRSRRWWLCACVCVGLSVTPVAVTADDAILHSGVYGQCPLQLESHNDTLSIRVQSRCVLSRTDFTAFLRVALAALPSDQLYTSLFLGRVVEYPWVSEQVVQAAQREVIVPHMKAAALHSFVQSVLMQPAVSELFSVPLARQGYRVKAASVEKVLVALPGARPVPPWVSPDSRLPFDALWHYTLIPAPVRE